MAYRQYTKCVPPGDFSDFSFTKPGILNIIGMFLFGTITAVIVAAVAGGPIALIGAIALMTEIVAYLHWWLNGRLICLGREPCLIGMVRSLSAANPIEKAGDDDFSMNLMLAPGPTAFRSDFAADDLPMPPVSEYQNALQGELVSPNSNILSIGRGYVADEGHSKYVTGLHCEFEGSGIHNMLVAAGVVLALLIAALAAQLAAPGYGWIVSLLIMLAVLVFGFGILTGPLAGELAAGAGHPTDVGEHLKELANGDIVVVKGEWVYDSLHHGWNEIHPIRDCCIVARAADTGAGIGKPWPPGFGTDAEVKDLIKLWCPMLDDARDCEKGGSRDDPANDWILHPLVDGCSRVILT